MILHHGEGQNLIIPLLEFQLKVYLEGLFSGLDMNNDLLGILPLSQPYTSLPYNYHGGEEVIEIPNANIVDWILVELRDASCAILATSDRIIRRKAAFLNMDGSIVDMDGISPLAFNYSVTDSLFVVVWHRNHLGVMSATPLIENLGYYSYDFTDDPDKVYGGILGAKELSNNVWVMVAGDANSDRIVDQADKSEYWYLEAGLSGYYFSDLNMDTQTDNKDKDDIWLPNVGRSSQVPD